MKCADELGIGDFLSSSLAVTTFAFVWFAFQQEMCARIYPWDQCPPWQSHPTFQGMVFSNSASILEGTFAEIFLCIFGKLCISGGLCQCRWSPLCLFHIKTRDGEHMKMLWTNSWRDPHARIFSVQQCLKRQQVMLVPVSIICIMNEI